MANKLFEQLKQEYPDYSNKKIMSMWWEIKSEQYPYQTTVKTSDASPQHYDHLKNASVVFEKGFRTWGFTTKEDLESFKSCL